MSDLNSPETGVHGNLDNPMTRAIKDVVAFQEYVEKAELTIDEVGSFLEKANANLFDPATRLGKFLEGDAILVQTGLTKVTEDSSDLTHLAGLYFAGDALFQADDSLVGDSGLTLAQLKSAGAIIKDMCKDIATNASIEPELVKGSKWRFFSNLNLRLEEYKTSGLLHKDAATVNAAMNKG